MEAFPGQMPRDYSVCQRRHYQQPMCAAHFLLSARTEVIRRHIST